MNNGYMYFQEQGAEPDGPHPHVPQAAAVDIMIAENVPPAAVVVLFDPHVPQAAAVDIMIAENVGLFNPHVPQAAAVDIMIAENDPPPADADEQGDFGAAGQKEEKVLCIVGDNYNEYAMNHPPTEFLQFLVRWDSTPISESWEYYENLQDTSALKRYLYNTNRKCMLRLIPQKYRRRNHRRIAAEASDM